MNPDFGEDQRDGYYVHYFKIEVDPEEIAQQNVPQNEIYDTAQEKLIFLVSRLLVLNQ